MIRLRTKHFNRYYLGILLVVILAGLAGVLLGQSKTLKPKIMKEKFSIPKDWPCLNCAQLDIRLCSFPGYGCCGCTVLDELGIVCFLDPEFWVHNYGNLASNPGTMTMTWYDLYQKAALTRTYTIPAVPAHSDGEPIAGVITHILAKAADGITLTLDYSDSAGARHKIRKVIKCPDN